MARSERTRRKQHRQRLRKQLRSSDEPDAAVVIEEQPSLGFWGHIYWKDALLLLIVQPLVVGAGDGILMLCLCYLAPSKPDEPKSCCDGE